MAVTTALFWISLVLSIIGLNATGELSILHSPNSLTFSGSSKAPESSLKEIFSAALGLSVEEDSEWNGLLITDPFNTPEAVVEVYVDGVSGLGNDASLKSKKFPLIVDEYEPDTYDQVKHRVMQRFTNGGNKLVNINLSDPDEALEELTAAFVKAYDGSVLVTAVATDIAHTRRRTVRATGQGVGDQGSAGQSAAFQRT
ncbi:Renin receptor, partial [Operophtera brumata]